LGISVSVPSTLDKGWTQFHKGYHHQDPEYTRRWMDVTVPYMKDEQHNNECPELGIAVKTA